MISAWWLLLIIPGTALAMLLLGIVLSYIAACIGVGRGLGW